VTCAVLLFIPLAAQAEPWKRHTIDPASKETQTRGADGVRLADANGDGLLDIATGWEEGGTIRVYLNPGAKKAKALWPAVTVGRVASPEDAVLVDLDGDGALDVVSSCEGGTRTVFVHWAPKDKQKYLDPKAWKTQPFKATQKKQSWMYALPLDADGRNGVDLVVSSKGKNASVSLLISPKDPRDTAAWTMHRLYSAGWIMSLEAHDVDGDGDDDVVVSDRRGKSRGVLWLENPGQKNAAAGQAWKEHRIGAAGVEVLFLTVADLDKDGLTDIVTATRGSNIIYMRRKSKTPVAWQQFTIENPHGIRNGKAVRVADINLDGKPDIIHDANTGGDRSKSGVVWMSYRKSPTDRQWDVHDISGPQGVKFDLLQIVDLDGDGDLDVITCEERDNLGVFWYENPTR